MEQILDIDASGEHSDAHTPAKGDSKAAGRSFIGLAFAVSIGLHAAFFAMFALEAKNDRPALRERETLHVSWVSIFRDEHNVAKGESPSAKKTILEERRLEMPGETADKEASASLPSVGAMSRTEEERERSSGNIPMEMSAGMVSAATTESISKGDAKRIFAVTTSTALSATAERQSAESGIRPPRYLENNRPDYPLLARLRGYEGIVWLSVEVSPEGRVGDLRIRKSSGFDVLDQSAIRAVRNWRFEPARSMGSPVPMWVDLPVRFVLTEGALPS